METHRIQKLISNRGYCSRRKAEDLIRLGRVSVNGKIAEIGQSAPEDAVIIVEGKKLVPPKKLTIMFHKPTDCITAMSDKFKKTVMEYIDVQDRVFPIGRLDQNTSGLLLLTNDGDFANTVMHPRYQVIKTYEARCDTIIPDEIIKKLQEGITIDERKVTMKLVRKLSPNTIEITLHEGRKHIVKKILKECGLHVAALKRTKIGGLGLGSLKMAQWREITENEKKLIFGK